MGTTPPTHTCAVRFMNFCAETKFEKGASDRNSRPGTITTSWTRNGGLDSYVMWTRFHNDGNVPTQYAASTPSDRTVKFV